MMKKIAKEFIDFSFFKINQIIPAEESYKTSYTSNRLSVQPQTVNWLVENYETADGNIEFD